MTQQILLKNFTGASLDIEAYQNEGGYQALEKVLRQNKPLEVIEAIKRSGLRGRGGAGFPTGKKWEMVATHRETERYLVCNAGEHEPGTYKDRHLLRHNPHQLLEGIAIGAFSIGAKESFVFMNGAFAEEIDLVKQAIHDARRHGFLGSDVLKTGFSCDVQIFIGPDTYVAGPLLPHRLWPVWQTHGGEQRRNVVEHSSYSFSWSGMVSVVRNQNLSGDDAFLPQR
ncbi:MAG: hypothetical protein HY283_05425 [Nitrospirae bacterium]|nr:hypothetical protein [Nitrospirota bacterium]